MADEPTTGHNVPSNDLLAALSGRDAERGRAVAQRTRQVVLASQGVLRDGRISRKRNKALAAGSTLFILIAATPLFWWMADTLLAGEHLCEISGQIALWSCTLAPALLAAVLVAGWLHRKD
jgi:hypothetical protein